MVFGIIAAVIAVVASAGVYYQQKKMEAQARKQANEAKAVQVSGHDSNRGLYTVYGEALVGSTIVWKKVTDKEARITQSGFTTLSAATGSSLTTNKDHKNNRWLYRAVTLCNGPVTQVTNVTIDDEGYNSPRFTNRTTKHFATSISLGPEAGQNFSALRTAYSSTFGTWGSDATGKGVAYAMERLFLDKDKPAFQGEPQTKYKVKGRKLYDPRKDSTSSVYDSSLGTSSHRADTSSTWEWSDNPVLALLDYMRSEEYGRGLPLSVIDLASIATAADKCDVLVDVPQVLTNDTGSTVTYYDPETGEEYTTTINAAYPYYRANQTTTGTYANKQKRFRINIAIDPSKEILDNIQEILNVFRGNLSYANGKYLVHMADVQSSVLSLDDDDIIGGLKIANGDRSQRMNRATVKFINENKQHKTDQVSWPSLDSNEDGGLYDTYLAEDEDEKLHRTFTVKGCTDYYQAQDTAEFLVRESRSNLTVSGTFGSRCFGLVPGDVVSLDYDSAGFSGKYFRVIQSSIDLVSMNVQLQLKEYDSSVYTWNTNRGNEPLGLSWQEEVVNAAPTNLTIGSITTNTRTRADGSTAITLTIPFSDVPEGAQYVEVSWAINGTNDYNTQIVFDTENQTQTEVAVERDGQTYAIRARYFATNSYGTLMPSDYATTTHAVADLSGTKLDGIEDGATQNTGALADLDTVDTDQIDNDAVTIAKLDTSLESTNYSAGVSGWKLTKAGVFEAGDGTFRGSISATSLSIAAGASVSGLDVSDVQNARYVDALFVRGTGANNNATQILRIGNTDVYNTTGRGMRLSVIKRSDHSVLTYQRDGTSSSTTAANQRYDAYGSTGAQIDLRDALVELRTNGNGTRSAGEYGSDIIIVITSYDANNLNTTNGGLLKTELKNNGATDRLNDFNSSTYRIPYLLVSVAGAGEGNGVEVMTGDAATDPYAEYFGTLVDGEIRGVIDALRDGVIINDGGITMDSGGAIQTIGKSSESDSTNGFFLGYNVTSNKYTFGVGDSSQSIQWSGSALSVTGNITADAFTLSSGASLSDADDKIQNTNNNAFFRYETTAANDDVSAPNNTAFSAAFGRNPRTRDVLVVVNTASNPDVSAAYVYNGSSWDAKNDFFTGDVIVDGTITADHLSVNSLDAISADLGSITSGSLNIGSGNFTVASDGTMTATGATITGGSVSNSTTVGGTAASTVASGAAAGATAVQDDTMFSAKIAWGFDEDSQDFIALQHITLTHNSDGYIVLTSTGNDPILRTPTIALDGGKDHIIRARIKRTAGTGWDGNVFYTTSGHGETGSYSKDIADPTTLNEWVVAEWDMSNLTAGGTDWVDNTITQVRFDFGTSSSDVFQVDWIAIGTVGSTALREGADVQSGSVGGISIEPSKLYAGTGTWQNANTGFYLDDSGKFSLKDKLFFNPTNDTLTVDGSITADVITAKQNLVVLGDLEASSVAAGSITRAMLSQDALDEIFGSLATSVGGSNGDFKEGSGSFTTSGGSVTLGTSSDKFDHGSSSVDVEFNINTYFYATTNYTEAQAQATLTFEASADGTFNDLNSADKTHTLQFLEYDLSSYYGTTYLVYYLNTAITKTFTSGSGNDLADNTDVQFRVAVSGVGSAFTGQTIAFTASANEGVTGVTSTGGNADTLDNLDSTKFLRSDQDDTFDANLTITGNLTVQGTQTSLEVATLQVEDKNVVLNFGSGDTSGSADGAGITIQDAVDASTDATILWDTSNDRFNISHTINTSGNLIVASGYVQSHGAYFSENLRVLNAAGNGWHTWATRSNGNYNIDVASIETTSLSIDAPTVSLANQPNIMASMDATGTDGYGLLSLRHLTNSTAAAMGAGIELKTGEGTTGSATQEAYFILRGAGQNDLLHIAPYAHKFYVDYHDNDLTGTTYYDYGTLALTLADSGAAKFESSVETGGNIDLNGYGISSDNNGMFYSWRALNNTSSTNPAYKKIARVTGSQSTRFMITLTGRSQGYGDGQKGSKTEIYGQLNNDDNYDITYTNFDFSATGVAVTEIGFVDVGGASVDIYVKASSFSELAAYGVVSDGSITPDSTSSVTTSAPSGYTAATSNTIWTDESFSSTNITNWNTAYDYGPNAYKVNVTSEDAQSGTWNEVSTSDSWGSIKYGAGYAYSDTIGGYKQFNIPSGYDTAYMSFLTWSNGGYVDIHAVQADGDLVWTKRVNTYQNIENSNHGNSQEHDGLTTICVGTGLDNFSAIRVTNKSGRVHLTGVAFTKEQLAGMGGNGIVHGAQIRGAIDSVTSLTASSAITSSGIVKGQYFVGVDGQEVILAAGESQAQLVGVTGGNPLTGEYVYAVAEGGLQVISSPGNWSSGGSSYNDTTWGLRKTATINDSSGNSSLPGALTVASNFTMTGGFSVYLGSTSRFSSDNNGGFGINYGTTGGTATASLSIYNNTTQSIALNRDGSATFSSNLTVGPTSSGSGSLFRAAGAFSNDSSSLQGASNVPLVVQATGQDTTAFGMLNHHGYQNFALNVSGSTNSSTDRGTTDFYNRNSGTWSLFLRASNSSVEFPGALTWSGGSSANANTAYSAVNSTNLGDTATGLVAFTQQADWSKPAGYSSMIRGTGTNASVVGTPKSASYWYYQVIGKRDTGGGTAALLTNYTGQDIYFGHTTGATAPTWYQLWSSYDFNKTGLNYYKGNLNTPSSLNWNDYGDAAGEFGHIEIYDGTAFNVSGRHTNYPNDVVAGTSTVPYSYGTLTYRKGSSHNYQMWSSHYSSSGGGLWYRTGWTNSWFGWVQLWDSGNDAPLAKKGVANTFTAANTFSAASTFNSTVSVSNTLNANEGVFGVNTSSNQGIHLDSADGTGSYARIRYREGTAGTNRNTIHFFNRNWQSGTLSGQSAGSINLDGDYGVTFGAWNAIDGYVDSGGFHTGSGKHYYIGSTTVLNNLRELQNITKLNGYTITKPNLLQWTALTAYAYDATNGLRHYWHKVATMPEYSGKLEIDVTVKSDENYPHAASAKIYVASWNATSISALIDRWTGVGSSNRIEVWLDNSRNVWIRANAAWSHYFEYRIVKNSNVTIPTLTSSITQPANSIQADRSGLGYRFLQSNIAGGANNYYSYPKEHYEFSAVNAYLVNGTSVINSSRQGLFTDVIATGNVTAYGSHSDINLKESIKVIPEALKKVSKLRGVTFTYKKDGTRSTGLIAQELIEAGLPEVVYSVKDPDDETEHLAVRYGNVAGLLVESIKELKKENDELRAMLAEIMEKLNGDH